MRFLMRCAKSAVAIELLLLGATNAQAEQSVHVADECAPKSAVSATARLDFSLTLGKFLSLQVGSSGNTIDTVSFDLTALAAPSCTTGPLGLCFGNATPVAAISNGALPVTIKSNAGQVKLHADIVAGLTSGTQSIPLSQIVLTSSDPSHLPAPVLPNSGASADIDIAGSAFAGKVTDRSAQWTFAYANTVIPVAGAYSGQVRFTATAP